MWGNLSIGRKLGSGFGVVVLCAVILGLIGWGKIQDINTAWMNFESVTLSKRKAVSDAQIGLQDGIHHFKNYVLRAGDYAEKFADDMSAIAQSVSAYRQAGAASAAEEKLLGEVDRGIQAYREAMRQAVKLREEGQGPGEIDRAIKGADKALNIAFQQLLSINAEETRAASGGIDRVVASASAWLAGISLFIVVLASAIAFKVTHDIVQPLKTALAMANQVAAGDLTSQDCLDRASSDEIGTLLRALHKMRDELARTIHSIIGNAEHLNDAAAQLSASAQQVASGSESQSQSTSTAAAAVEQLTVSIDHVGSNADAASRRAADAGRIATRGGGEVATATQHISNVALSVDNTARDIQDLSEQVQRIGGIATVIREVAEQTNLLALNAAIEAARAGEQGRGFAVVADEVRKLAERTSSSVKEITSTTDAIRVGADTAVLSMQKSRNVVSEVVDTAETAAASMTVICQATDGVRNTISEISTALREQRSTSTELARSVESIAQMSEENAAAVGQVAETAQGLAKVSADLHASVSRFQL